MSPLQPTFMLGRQEKSGRTGESGRRPRTVVEARLRPSPRDYSSPAARAGDRKRTTPNRTTQPRRLAPRPPQVAVQYNLANEPWDKFSMAAVADRGLKPQLWTSGRLRKEARPRSRPPPPLLHHHPAPLTPRSPHSLYPLTVRSNTPRTPR